MEKIYYKYQEAGGRMMFSLTLFRVSALRCTGGWVLEVRVPLTVGLTAVGMQGHGPGCSAGNCGHHQSTLHAVPRHRAFV